MNDQDELWIASRRYLTGEISLKEYQAIEEPYYKADRRALYILSMREVSLWRRFKRWTRQEMRKR
jgi:hypothetical protein